MYNYSESKSHSNLIFSMIFELNILGEWFVKTVGLLPYHGMLWIHVAEEMVKARMTMLNQFSGPQKFPQWFGPQKFPQWFGCQNFPLDSGSGQKFPKGNSQKMCCYRCWMGWSEFSFFLNCSFRCMSQH